MWRILQSGRGTQQNQKAKWLLREGLSKQPTNDYGQVGESILIASLNASLWPGSLVWSDRRFLCQVR